MSNSTVVIPPPSAGRRVLVTGGAGLLGRALLQSAPREVELHATQRRTPASGAITHTVELSEEQTVTQLWERVQPQLVFHTAYSMEEGERDIWLATRRVVAACRAIGARLIYLSTDALLDGERAPYDEGDEPSPVYEYGRWKAQAELYVQERLPSAAIVRTSLITSLEPMDPRTEGVVESLRESKALSLFVDELRCPIIVEDLAKQLWEIASLPLDKQAGVWHLAGPEALSRYALGLLIAAHQGLDAAGITPRFSVDHPEPRPRDLRLLTTRADRMLSIRARPISVLMTEGRNQRPDDRDQTRY